MNLEVQAIALGVQITGVGQLVDVDNVGVLLWGGLLRDVQ